MNLSCPHCGQGVKYNVELAGNTVKCPNCQKPVLMPPLNNLPPQYKKEYLEEQEYMAEQELIRKKEEEIIRKQQEEQLEIARGRQYKIEKEKLKQEIVKVKRPIAEDPVKTRYLWLSILAIIYDVAGGIGIFFSILALLLLVILFFIRQTPSDVSTVFVFSIYGVIASITSLAIGELIHLIINVANDLSGTKALLKRIAYPNEETNPPENK